MTPEEILNQAADLIEAAPKLAKGVYHAYDIELDESGRESGLHVRWDEADNAGTECYCTTGALARIVGWTAVSAHRNRDYARAVHSLGELLAAPGDAGTMEAENVIFQWNDDPERTKDEVVQTLRAAAEVARVRAS